MIIPTEQTQTLLIKDKKRYKYMIQATTPTFILTLPQSINFNEAHNIYFTIKQNNVSVTKTAPDLTFNNNIVTVYLSQSDTVSFTLGKAEIQLNWTYINGQRACSNVVEIPVDKNLLKRVIE